MSDAPRDEGAPGAARAAGTATSAWRPTPAEERWLAAGAELRGLVSPDEIRARAGGWRTTGVLARLALFALGVVAAALIAALCYALSGFAPSELPIVLGGLLAVGTGEWLVRAKRLHASGIEEGLVVAGAVLAAIGLLAAAGGDRWQPVLALVLGAAGLRLLNPFLTALAAGVAIGWLGSLAFVPPLDARLGPGGTALLLAVLVAGVALAAGARRFERPSHDRMLDWLVVALPAGFYVASPAWAAGLAGAAAPLAEPGVGLAAPLLLGLAVAYLATAARRRTAAPLRGALACLACLVVELQRLLQVDPAWWAIGAGLAVLVAAIVLDRWLRTPRAGVTSVRLDPREGPLDLLQTAGASVLAQNAGAADPRAPAGAGGDFGGGRYGGGGASGGY